MVIIVAFLLAFVSSSLSGIQNANVENDTKGQILTALGYDKATVNVGEVYEQNVKDSLWDKESLRMKPYEDKFKTSYGAAIKSGELHVFTATAADGSKAYVISGSDSELISRDSLKNMSDEDLRLAINEIYARHGRKFDDEELQNYFNSKDWYEGKIDASDFKESELSDIEMANRDLIVEYEKKKGYR